MKELEARVAAWAEVRGLDRSVGTGHLLKLVEEVGELAGVHVKQKPRAELLGEAADVLICLIMFAQAVGVDLVAAAHEKMTTNEGRTGKVNSFGVYVKTADQS